VSFSEGKVMVLELKENEVRGENGNTAARNASQFLAFNYYYTYL
jgi:hypothetical protein